VAFGGTHPNGGALVETLSTAVVDNANVGSGGRQVASVVPTALERREEGRGPIKEGEGRGCSSPAMVSTPPGNILKKGRL
jgi:hypothetical protein